MDCGFHMRESCRLPSCLLPLSCTECRRECLLKSLYQQVRTDSLDDERPARALSVAESIGEPIGRQQARLDQLQDSVSSLQQQMQQQVTMIKDIQASLSSLHLIARSRAVAEGQETARQTT